MHRSAQVRCQTHGIQEVVGSTPISSTLPSSPFARRYTRLGIKWTAQTLCCADGFGSLRFSQPRVTRSERDGDQSGESARRVFRSAHLATIYPASTSPPPVTADRQRAGRAGSPGSIRRTLHRALQALGGVRDGSPRAEEVVAQPPVVSCEHAASAGGACTRSCPTSFSSLLAAAWGLTG